MVAARAQPPCTAFSANRDIWLGASEQAVVVIRLDRLARRGQVDAVDEQIVLLLGGGENAESGACVDHVERSTGRQHRIGL